MESIFRTPKRPFRIRAEIERNNCYRSSWQDVGIGVYPDDRSRLIGPVALEVCSQQDAHIRSLVDRRSKARSSGASVACWPVERKGEVCCKGRTPDQDSGSGFSMKSLSGVTYAVLADIPARNNGRIDPGIVVAQAIVLSNGARAARPAGRAQTPVSDMGCPSLGKICISAHQRNYVLINTGRMGFFATTPLIWAAEIHGG